LGRGPPRIGRLDDDDILRLNGPCSYFPGWGFARAATGGGMTNKAWALQGGFGIDRLALEARAEQQPGFGEARVRIEWISLNRRDLLLVEGVYNPRQVLPIIPCSDGAGTIEALGEGCRRLKARDRVAVHFFPGWIAGEPDMVKLSTALGGPGGDGTLRQTLVISEEALLRLPDNISTQAAATLPCAALTAWSAIVEQGGVKPGATVLTQGTGGVSLFAVQFAKMLGARVVATTSSEAKAEKLRELGADHVVNYRADHDWARRARALAGGVIDLIVEVGGADTLDASLRIIRPGGTIALIGVLSGAKASINLPLAVMRQVRLQGVTCGHRENFEAMLRAIAAHGIDPVISHRFGFADARAAFRCMAGNDHVGKIVIETTQQN
jgi:NADPH:quinone reductase-like Zn-dependent oxidoreductase